MFLFYIWFLFASQRVLMAFDLRLIILDFYLISQVALKFEHRNSKGCSYGPPYEWQVYKYVPLFILLCSFS